MTKQCQGILPDLQYYHIITHGGIGDISWVYSKLCNVELPLFIDVCSEEPYRPKRVGNYLDTLPRVIGWRYVPNTFGKAGSMWTDGPSDPAAAFHIKWADLGLKPNTPTKLECNKWLESGYKLSDWLPDLPTSYHYDFDDAHIPIVPISQPAVGLHFTGWPDIYDGLWVEAAKILSRRCYVYLISAPYDNRTKRLLPQLEKAGHNIHTVVGESWSTAWSTLKQLKYIIGHASGMTVLSNVLKIPGAVVNPLCHKNLRNTWNDPKFSRQIQIQTNEEFISAARRIAESMPSFAALNGNEDQSKDDELGETLLKAVMQQDKALSHNSSPEDFLSALGKYRSPKRILYIGSRASSIVGLMSGVYSDRNKRIEVVHVIDLDPKEDIIGQVRTLASRRPFKPAVKCFFGPITSEEARKSVCQTAPFDLAIVDIDRTDQNDIYNGLSLACYVAKTGCSLILVNNLISNAKVETQYLDFCFSRDRPVVRVKTPNGWGLLFQ